MQNKINFVKINKLKAALLGIIMLLFLIFTAERAVPVSSTAVQLPSPVDGSKYKQLESVCEIPEWKDIQIFKMNNRFEKNSENNSDIERVPVCIQNVKTIKMLDASTGVIHELDLEYYVLCSVIAEMPLNFDSQALMAQAVACRTLAVRNAMYGNDKHPDAAVCSDFNCCQSMKDANTCGFNIAKAKEAVDATKGIVATYGGKPIVAAYHSSSAGYTKSSAEKWGGSLDYLVPVIAPENKEIKKTTHYINEALTISTLQYCGLGENVQFTHGENGLCSGATADNGYLTPRQIKAALNLRSDAFDVSFDGTNYVFNCYGFGHGVGMSQYGADALAKQGYDFYEILKYFYTGIEFDFVNEAQ